MLTKFLVLHALIAFSVADVSHLSLEYLPPAAAAQRLDQKIKPQQQQQKVQHDEVLRDEATNGNAHAVTDAQQSLENETENLTSDGESSDPFARPGLVGFGGFPGSRPAFPGQGFPTPTVPISVYVGQFPGTGEGFPLQSFPGQGFPGQGFPGQGFPGQGFPSQGFPGQGFPGQGFPGQGFPVQGFPGQGFPGQGFPVQGFPGQGFPGQGFPGQGFPGQGFPGQSFPGQGFPGQGFPIQGIPGQGFPPQVGGFPGVPYQTNHEQHPVDFNTASTSGSDVRNQETHVIASDTIYGENGGYVYDKPK